ncbi:MAG: zinc ABC transporter substrate-binding protein [bacterium]|nr:MAG: zinc ABC transporter substrate-binding protein [bacterium]
MVCAGCGRHRPENGTIGVAVTVAPQAQFVERIGGEYVRVTVMVPPGANPHTYEPKPSQLVDVSRAQIYIKVGSGIEFELAWFEKVRSVNPRMHVVNLSERIEAAKLPHHHGNADDTGEGEHLDPHIWVSPKNVMIMVEQIHEALVAVDPNHREYYRANTASYLEELHAVDNAITRTLEGARKREFIVFHPAWGYFARDYGLKQIAIEKKGKEPTARDIRLLITLARERGVTVVFASPQFSSKSAKVVAGEIGGSVVPIDPLDRDYIGNMRRVAGALAAAMR